MLAYMECHKMKKINKNIFFQSLLFRQTATGSKEFLGLTKDVFWAHFSAQSLGFLPNLSTHLKLKWLLVARRFKNFIFPCQKSSCIFCRWVRNNKT